MRTPGCANSVKERKRKLEHQGEKKKEIWHNFNVKRGERERKKDLVELQH